MSVCLNELIELMEELRTKISKFRDKLSSNEFLVRYCLVDPLLRALGWDTSDPEQVEVEYVDKNSGSRMDYVLKIGGEIRAIVEAKPLREDPRRHLDQLILYGVKAGVPYLVATNGDKWILYDIRRFFEGRREPLVEWSVTEEPAIAALKSLAIANTSALGLVPPQLGVAQVAVEPERREAITAAEVFKGPLKDKVARFLILRVLAEKGPLSRRRVVEEVGKRVKLTSHDMEVLKSGRRRWEVRVRWGITGLHNTGLVERVKRGVWRITEKGLEELERLERELGTL